MSLRNHIIKNNLRTLDSFCDTDDDTLFDINMDPSSFQTLESDLSAKTRQSEDKGKSNKLARAQTTTKIFEPCVETI